MCVCFKTLEFWIKKRDMVLVLELVESGQRIPEPCSGNMEHPEFQGWGHSERESTP